MLKKKLNEFPVFFYKLDERNSENKNVGISSSKVEVLPQSRAVVI